jgi:hypothetical protein
VSAGAGGPRRVRYELKFTHLQGAAALVSLLVGAAGWGLGWHRGALIAAILTVWALLYGAPYAIAHAYFRRLLETGTREALARHRTPNGGRASTTPGSTASSAAPDPGPPSHGQPPSDGTPPI